jgi:hypothetical protein
MLSGYVIFIPNSDPPLTVEINQYRALQILCKNVDVQAFWNDNSKNYSLLCKAVHKYFCIQGNIHIASVTSKRNKLDLLNVNMLVYLRENLGKVQLDCLIVENAIEEEEEKKFWLC